MKYKATFMRKSSQKAVGFFLVEADSLAEAKKLAETSLARLVHFQPVVLVEIEKVPKMIEKVKIPAGVVLPKDKI